MYFAESDDSDGEGGLGNVSRVVMRPPGHSGKAKKGHLCFDASFETGNISYINLTFIFILLGIRGMEVKKRSLTRKVLSYKTSERFFEFIV